MNTPLHNDLPAVFLHSAALDNLITLGPRALSHTEPTVPILDVSLPDFILLVRDRRVLRRPPEQHPARIGLGTR